MYEDALLAVFRPIWYPGGDQGENAHLKLLNMRDHEWNVMQLLDSDVDNSGAIALRWLEGCVAARQHFGVGEP